MRRIAAYFVGWFCVIAAAVSWRFTYLRGTDSDHRLPLAIFVMMATAVLFMAATLYESRRLAVIIGFRGRSGIGYLRGWLRTVVIELASNDDQVPPEALREWCTFRSWSGYAFASLIIVVPVLLF